MTVVSAEIPAEDAVALSALARELGCRRRDVSRILLSRARAILRHEALLELMAAELQQRGLRVDRRGAGPGSPSGVARAA